LQVTAPQALALLKVINLKVPMRIFYESIMVIISIQLVSVMKSCLVACKRELVSQATNSVKKLESLAQARFFALRILHEINAIQNQN